MIKNYKKPNFLIVGTAKSGTTSLYHYLRQHPEIYLPDKKEPCFFIQNSIKNHNNDKWIKKAIEESKPEKWYIDTLPKYLDLFKDVNEELAIGEASATYLYYFKESIDKIKKYLGDVKIIIILRNPIEKAFSHYKYLKGGNAEPYDFLTALNSENERKKNNYCSLFHYISQCKYHDQVKAFMDNFSKIKIITSEDLRNNTEKVLKEIYIFLNVNSAFKIKYYSKFNMSKSVPRLKILQKTSKFKLYNKLGKLLSIALQKLGQNFYKKIYIAIGIMNIKLKYKDEKYIKNILRQDVTRLEKLLGRKFPKWK